MTEKQARVFEYVEAHIKKYRVSPSLSQIADAMGFTTNGQASTFLGVLVKKGLLRRITSGEFTLVSDINLALDAIPHDVESHLQELCIRDWRTPVDEVCWLIEREWKVLGREESDV